MLYTKIMEKVKDYQEAIRITCEILYKNGDIETYYYDAILKNMDQYGGYFYLGEGICMPHASPIDGVRNSAACLLKLEVPVDFYGHDVSIFLTLASQNGEQHFELLRNVAHICSEKENLHRLMQSEDEEEIRRMFGGK